MLGCNYSTCRQSHDATIAIANRKVWLISSRGYLCYPLLLRGEQGLVYALQMYYFLCL